MKLLIENDIGVSRVTHDLIELREDEPERACEEAEGEALPDAELRAGSSAAAVGPSKTNTPTRTHRGRKGTSVGITGLPTESEMEVPLLRAIVRRGGSVSGKEQRKQLAGELADDFALADAQRAPKVTGHTDSVWLKRIRWVRQNLVLKGDMARGPRGVWSVTEQGRERVRQHKRQSRD